MAPKEEMKLIYPKAVKTMAGQSLPTALIIAVAQKLVKAHINKAWYNPFTTGTPQLHHPA